MFLWWLIFGSPCITDLRIGAAGAAVNDVDEQIIPAVNMNVGPT